MSNFYNEVKTQPESLIKMLDELEKENFNSIRKASELIKKSSKVVFSGMGTSFYAPNCILMEFRKTKTAFVVEASEMERDGVFLMEKNDVLVLISQSGESIELVNTIKLLKGKVPIISITNNPKSTLAKYGDVVIFLHAGEERSITNKTFTNTMAVLFILSDFVSDKNPSETFAVLRNAYDEMNDVIDNRGAEILSMAEYLAPTDNLHFIGRKGISMAIANQSGLIYMEGAACNARAFSSGAFRHGPIEICSINHRILMYDCIEDEEEVMKDLAEQISSYGSRLCIVSNRIRNQGKVFRIYNSDPRAYAMVAAIFMELLLIKIAEMHGKVAGEFCITNKICVKE